MFQSGMSQRDRLPRAFVGSLREEWAAQNQLFSVMQPFRRLALPASTASMEAQPVTGLPMGPKW